jgi:hypothetical protein
MLFHADGGNVLGHDQVDRVFQAIDAVRNLNDYDEICSQDDYVDKRTNKTTCEILGVTEFWNNSAEIFKTSVTSDADTILALSASTFPDGKPVSENDIFGKRERGENGNLTFAQLYAATIILPDIDETEDFESDVLELLLDGLREEWEQEKGNDFRMEVNAWRSFDDE